GHRKVKQVYLRTMKWTGNIRKMKTEYNDPVQYKLPLFDVLDFQEDLPMNQFVGKTVKLTFENQINCVVTGKKIRKTYGEGMSFDAWKSSPNAVESIIRPELSRIHEGIALRDKEWEEKHHNQPHIVYLSKTAGIKVGVTRDVNVPYRWIDQGAIEAIVLAEVPYRQLAGLIEVSLKEHLSDKTNWRAMLKNDIIEDIPLIHAKEEALELLSEEFFDFISEDDEVTEISYPVEQYPEKVKSFKLDKVPETTAQLNGIKGQYLLFEGGNVINLRSHAGYRVSIEVL
ncbi:MAG: DUF2797 domain-containing protein, partial [Bacteroidota bacterium]